MPHDADASASASTSGRETPRRARIDAFDHLRGYFVALIIVTHLYLSPNLIEVVTGRGALPASAAEGFCAISGIVMGYVFLPRVRRDGLRPVTIRLVRRALMIYLAAVALTGIRLMFAAREGTAVDAGTVVEAVTLRTAAGVEPDFLALYALVVLGSPLVLWAAAHRREWIAIALTGVTWLIAQFAPALDDADAMRLSWSFLFVMGVTIGCRWPELARAWRRLPARARSWIATALVVGFVASALLAEFLIFWNHHLLVAAAGADGPALDAMRGIEARFLAEWTWFGPLQDKASLAPFRLVIGTLWFAALFLVFRRVGPRLDRALGGMLTTFGRNSLEAYVAHRLVIELVIAPTIWVRIAERDDILLNTAVVIATEVVVLVSVRAWLAVRARPAVRAARRAGTARDRRDDSSEPGRAGSTASPATMAPFAVVESTTVVR
ncbi:hypothetical protein GCM10017608_22300 [Agromyces luteolus]|uniref:Acyltransferase family protein n=1 Tax=Agromyces luteolus TaxID=88373 RepID=A0A7C9LUC3_9MICO|nr:OpgC domain-containing protein [Agromyces luteolus]MUN05979.1 hypothetical protein [Agromyces luteolus]GLK28296.1 hypothetical protein GCM10017608_22300 [Agromyces luteolus]